MLQKLQEREWQGKGAKLPTEEDKEATKMKNLFYKVWIKAERGGKAKWQ